VHNAFEGARALNPKDHLKCYSYLLRTRGVSHFSLAIYIKKHQQAKEELWKFKYFTMQKYNLQKNPVNETKILLRYHNSITNLKFQHKPEYQFSKILI
jgi:hypothetical protein